MSRAGAGIAPARQHVVHQGSRSFTCSARRLLTAVPSPWNRSQLRPWHDSSPFAVIIRMDRALVERNLALAETHVAKSERIVAEQRRLVAELERDGHSVELARTLLTSYEQTLLLHVADRERLRGLLAGER